MTVAHASGETLHQLSADDYHRMIEAEILTEDDKVDLLERCIEVHRSPEGEAYAEVLRVSPGESVTPSGVDAPPLDVGALLWDGS